MPIDAEERMQAAERRGYACQSLEHAKEAVLAAAAGACDCNTKSNNPIYHLGYCRWLKLMGTLDKLDVVSEYLNQPAART